MTDTADDIETELEFLRKAVVAGDPKAEILLRIDDAMKAATHLRSRLSELEQRKPRGDIRLSSPCF